VGNAELQNLIAVEQKLQDLKTEMQEVLMKNERRQEEFNDLESENLRLENMLKLKGEDEARINEEITNLQTKADAQSSNYNASIKAKEVELKKCLGDVKQLQQSVAKVQSSYEDTKKLLKQSVERFDISEKKVKVLGAELEGERQEKILLESDLNKIYGHVGGFVKKLESELKRVRMLREKDDSKENGQSVIMTNIVQQDGSAKSEADSRIDDITSRLEAAWNAVNDERDFLRSKLTTQGIGTNEEVQSKKDFVKMRLNALERRHKRTILERDGLEAKVTQLSSELQKLQSRVKIMGMTIREGTKGRKKLRQMLDEAKRGKGKAETDLLAKESHYSKQIQELTSKLVDLEAISKAHTVEKNSRTR